MSAGLPSEVWKVEPTNVSEFYATRWTGYADDEAINWLADRFNWKVTGEVNVTRFGRRTPGLIFYHRGKRHAVALGEWIVVVSSSGAVRIVTDKQFHDSYRKVER
jgi:hypothetical protein